MLARTLILTLFPLIFCTLLAAGANSQSAIVAYVLASVCDNCARSLFVNLCAKGITVTGSCDTGLLGTCANGEYQCNGNNAECHQVVQAITEVCDDGMKMAFSSFY